MTDSCYRLLDRATTPDGSDMVTERFESTEHTRSVWGAHLQHAGPVAGLLTRATEQAAEAVGSGMLLNRLTVEVLGAVPVSEVEVSARVLRPGRRIALIGAEMSATVGGSSRAVASASAWFHVAADSNAVEHRAEGELAGRPADDAEGTGSSILPDEWGSGFVDAVDWHIVDAPAEKERPTSGWLRLRMPLVADEEPTAAQRFCAIADVANGVGARLDPRQWSFLNTDLTVHLFAPPEGAWVGMRAETSVGPTGQGMATATLFDTRGAVGRVAQGLLVQPAQS